jgi:hypothetical protein
MTEITYYVAWPFVASDGGVALPQTTRFSGPSSRRAPRSMIFLSCCAVHQPLSAMA